MEVWRNELYHHGVLGMRWGVRRYQNPDGSLTAEGRRRRKTGSRAEPVHEGKKISELSDEELNSRLNRARKEKELRQLTGQDSYENLKQRVETLKLKKQIRELSDAELNPGMAFAKEIMADSGKKILKSVMAGAVLYGIKAAATGEFNAKEFGNAVFNGGPKKK